MIALAGKVARRAPVEADALAAFVEDDVTREAVTRIADERGWPAAVLAGGVAAAARALAVVDAPRVLLLDLAASEDPVADVQAIAAMVPPSTRIVTLGTVNDVALWRALHAAGAADYLVKPAARDALAEALARAHAAEAAPGEKAAGRLALVVGVRGGVGASTVALGIAWIAGHALGRSTVLVDLDLQFGTVALGLDLEPGGGLREALSDPERIDELFLDRALVKAGGRLAVLGSEDPLDLPTALRGDACDALLSSLRARHELVLVDLPRGLAVAEPELLAAADELVLVCDLSLASLRDANRLRRWAVARAPDLKVTLVANRAVGKRGQLGAGEFAGGLDGPVDAVVPLDAKGAAKAANTGHPLAETGGKPVRAALEALARSVSATAAPRPPFWRRALRPRAGR